MNHKAQGPNRRPVGSPTDDEVVADLMIACDEALRTGTDWPNGTNETAKFADLDPKIRERLTSAKDCLHLIERVRQFRQTETQEWPTGAAAALLHDNAYAAGGTIQRIGRFEIIRELGRGSHGVVFLARDPALNREIALKVPRPEAILTPQLRSRFLREGKAAARLNHPNIVAVHEAGEAGPICYLVQSYCSGPSLAAWLAKEQDPVPCRLAAQVVAELADGVDHAHKQSILHRDIKPANVMLEMREVKDGERGAGEKQDEGTLRFVPKLTDFGLAKALDDDPNATATLGAIGTATYMPPEQARGQMSLVGPPSDVYSLGALLYEMLTQRPPIVGANQLETLRLIVSEEPRLIRQLRPDVPVDLEAICLKCLEKSPDRRYSTAAELAADLRRFLDGESVLASPVSKIGRTIRRLRRLPLSVPIGLAAIALLVGALGMSMAVIWIGRGTLVGPSPGPRPNTEADYLGGIEHVSQGYFDAVANRGDVKSAVREVDTFLERHHPQRGETDHRGFEWNYLWRQCHPDQVAQPFPKLFDLVGHKGDIYFVTFSPSGSLLASAGQDHASRIWDVKSGKLIATLTGHTDEVNWVSFFSDHRVLTASDDKTVRYWDCDTGKTLAVLSDPESKVIAVEVADPIRHDGNRTKREWEIVAADHAGRLLFWDLAMKPIRVIQAHGARIEAIAPSRGHEWWITASEDGTATEWNGVTWTPMRTHVVDSADSGGSHPSIDSVSCNTDATLAAFGWGRGVQSGHGSFAPATNAAGGLLGGMITIDDLLTGTRWLSLTGAGRGANECVRFVPGQCALVSTCRDEPKDGGDVHDVAYWDLPTEKFWKPFAGSHPPSWCAAFSPDGTRMATAGNDGIVRMWDSSVLPHGTRLNSVGGNRERPPGTLQFSPDGRRLLVTYVGTYGPARGHTFVLWDMSGERPKPAYSESAREDFDGSFTACFSRDRRVIAVEARSRSGEIWKSCIRLLDADSLHEIGRLNGYEGLVLRVLLSPNAERIVAVTADANGPHCRLNVWDARQPGRPVDARNSVHPDDFLATALSPDGTLLVTNRGGLEIYEFPSMRLIEALPGDLGASPVSCFSPDGRLLATSGSGGTVHIWDVHSRRKLTSLHSDGHAILSLAFSPDGTRLAVGLDGASRVDLWHVPTGRRVVSLAMPSDLTSVTDLSFSPDSHILAAASRNIKVDGGVFLFSLGPVETSGKTGQP
jgi:eukaryotic-like serine/threonine-protein kinase